MMNRGEAFRRYERAGQTKNSASKIDEYKGSVLNIEWGAPPNTSCIFLNVELMSQLGDMWGERQTTSSTLQMEKIQGFRME